MALETGTYISDLVLTNPTASDPKSQGDDHIRLIKETLNATFPNISGEVTPTHTELNYVNGVTSDIQTQLDARANKANPQITGTISTEANLELSSLGSGDRASVIDLHADDTNTDFSARVIRNPGVNGNFDIANAGTGHIRFMNGGSRRMAIGSDGYVYMDNQPACVASRNINNNEAFAANTSYGFLGTFSINRGGFYAGSTIGTSGNALHVPATGYYAITLSLYVAANTVGRITVLKNNATGLGFIQINSEGAARSVSRTFIASLTAGDYINFKTDDNIITLYSGQSHTDIAITFLG